MPVIRNLQNITRSPRVRKLFVPRTPDEVLVEADLSQAEGMFVAWWAREQRLMEKYRNGDDVHSFTGSIIFQQPISKQDTPLLRQASKPIVHGSNYKMGAKTICDEVIKATEAEYRIEVAEAKKRQFIYFQNFPRIVTGFQMEVEQTLKQNNRVLINPVTGFARKFYTPIGQDLYRQAYAHLPQNTVAWLTNRAINQIRYNTRFGPNLYMQIHDAIVLSVPKQDVEEACVVLKNAMEHEIFIKNEPLTIPAEVEVGPSLGELEAVH